ncbi:MAG TPA: DUF2490 domain-containing protein [Chitinophagaceae bacterium]|nr:DUF2490 domain-containing protein [Chitinophagaceae bacterium]
MTKKILFTVSTTVTCIFCFSYVNAQSNSKQIIRQNEAWISANNTVRLSDKWGFIADFHVRRNDFFKKPDFYFIRFAADYWITNSLTVAGGYAHTWLAPTVAGWKTFSNESRIFEQVLYVSKLSKINVMQRIRNEQRWQQIMVNDKPSGQDKFSDRVRLLLNLSMPVFRNNKYPSPVIADELCIQFGKQTVYNTFDQNRWFVGLKQNITKDLWFDMGYMEVKQQLSTGYQYNLNRTFRLFFYYMPDWRRNAE